MSTTNSRAFASLSPSWVTTKQDGVSGIAPALGTIYPWTATASIIQVSTAGSKGAPNVGHYGPWPAYPIPADAAGVSQTPNPSSAWNTGEYAHSLGGPVHYDGAAWQDGVAP